MADSSVECKFCKKTFSTKGNLTIHQKTTKYCLQIQGEYNSKFECNLCSKTFTSKQTLQNHNCKQQDVNQTENYYINLLKEKDTIIKQKEEYINKIEAMLEKSNETIAEIAKQPTTSNTITNNNNKYLSVNFDIEDFNAIKQTLETHLTPSVLKQGQEGLADMLNSKLLRAPDGTPLYECTDISRKNFEFRNRNGDIEIDPQANRLIRNLERSEISKIAGEKSEEIWTNEDGTIDSESQNFYMPRVAEVMTLNTDSTKLRARLANLTARQKRVSKRGGKK
jgi:hypothetical protein